MCKKNKLSQFRYSLWVQRPQCAYCDRRLTFEQSTLDHIVPESRGGTSARNNLVLACAPCNGLKSDSILDAAGIAALKQESLTLSLDAPWGKERRLARDRLRLTRSFKEQEPKPARANLIPSEPEFPVVHGTDEEIRSINLHVLANLHRRLRRKKRGGAGCLMMIRDTRILV